MCKRLKIVVGGKHRHFPASRNCTNEEIGVRPLYALAVAGVGATRCFDVVGRTQGVVWERIQRVTELSELIRIANARQKLLPDGPQHQYAALPDQFDQFPQFRCGTQRIPAERQ